MTANGFCMPMCLQSLIHSLRCATRLRLPAPAEKFMALIMFGLPVIFAVSGERTVGNVSVVK